MAPPGVLSFYENSDYHNTPPSSSSPSSSLLLSPFPSFSDCINQISVYSDHSYFFKDIDNIKETSQKSHKMSPVVEKDCCFDPDIPSRDNIEVMTRGDDRTGMSPGLSSGGRTEVSDNVFNDVTLVNRLEAPDSSDTDFLQGLDDLDFDFDDDSEPSRGLSLQSFIDAALDDTITESINDHNNNNVSFINENGVEDDEEDVYKKQFFLKHLRLQRVSPNPTTTARKNRKRKHEESESNFSDPKHLTHLHPFVESVIPTPPSPNTVNVSEQRPPTQISSRFQNNTLLTPTLSVPSKLCSCASNDWKRSVLYSTAKSAGVTSVQTSPSTASLSGISNYNSGFAGFPYPSDDFGFQDNMDGRLSPSLLLSDKAKECFEFDLLDKTDIDEDTKDLLQWLDNHEVQTTIAGITSATNSSGPSSVHSLSPSESSSTSSIPSDDLEAMLSPTGQRSPYELDRYQDLEAYVSDSPCSPVSENDGGFKHITGNNVAQKHQLRLSILADISREFLNSKYSNRKVSTNTDNLKSCQTHTTHSSHRISKHHHSVSDSDYWSDSPFSSSSLSSPPYSPSDYSVDSVPSTQSKNLDLLDLFSDENSAWCL